MIAFIRATNIYTDSRATKEIQTLLAAGYKVLVIGWDRRGGALERCQKIFQSEEVSFYFFDVRVENRIGRNMVRGIGYLLSYFRFIYKTLCRHQYDITAVHACNLDSGISALRFCKKFHKKFIYDIYDYYIDSHEIPSILRPFIEHLEIKAINYADATIICNEERKEQIEGSQPQRVLILHNAPRLSDIDTCGDELYDFVYCGSLNTMRLIEEILNVYERNTDKKILFAGAGLYKKMCESIAAENENFSYVGPIPYAMVLKYESQAKVISAIYAPTIRNHRLCAPNKFYEAMALGKPVIVCKGTGIDKIVEQAGTGIVINYDASEFYEALEYLCSHPDVRKKMGEQAYKIFENKYKWEIMEEQLKTLYKTLF